MDEDQAPARPNEISERRRRVEAECDDSTWREGLIPSGRKGGGFGGSGDDKAWRERHWSSRGLHRVGEATAHSAAGVVAAVAVVLWAVVGSFYSFPEWWQTVLYSTAASITLVMVFAIQHTQSREQSATQRKLDELLRATPDADNHVIALEEAGDQELRALADLNLEDRHLAEERGA